MFEHKSFPVVVGKRLWPDGVSSPGAPVQVGLLNQQTYGRLSDQ